VPMDRVVPHFQEELEALQSRLLEMGGLAEERVRACIDALESRDLAVVAQVMAGDEPINQLHIEIDNRCFRLLALHQPMATDLRAIVAAVKINSDLERVGDLAVNIAEAARRYYDCGSVPEQDLVPRLADAAQAMLQWAWEAFVHGNLGLAQSVLERDDSLDSLRDQAFRRLADTMAKNPACMASVLELMLVTRHLERIGDHATNIAEDAFFVVAGEDVRHNAQQGLSAQ